MCLILAFVTQKAPSILCLYLYFCFQTPNRNQAISYAKYTDLCKALSPLFQLQYEVGASFLSFFGVVVFEYRYT